ncbi:MAG: acyl carrier protein [Saprospiraceae bacterium]|jgi:acyl carrier protein|tara:strand:- start:642 stop:893 length:252 start_codon:yes stop_codon:yes gene_type:complete
MNNQELIDKLKKIVKPYIQNEEAFENLSEETRFIEDLKINSANLVDVILDVEDEFDIEVGDDEMEQMLDVKSSIEIIAKKISK